MALATPSTYANYYKHRQNRIKSPARTIVSVDKIRVPTFKTKTCKSTYAILSKSKPVQQEDKAKISIKLSATNPHT